MNDGATGREKAAGPLSSVEAAPAWNKLVSSCSQNREQAYRASAHGRSPVGISSEQCLLPLEHKFLRHFLRLQVLERNLSRRARAGRAATTPFQLLEGERKKLAAELHTGVGQLLTAMRLQLELASNPKAGFEAGRAIERMAKLVAEALDQIRSISRRLYPPEWQAMRLETALRELWELSGIPQRFETTVDLQPLATELPLDVKVLLYRAAQEAISNIVRHSAATTTAVSLRRQGGTVILSIEDNGKGFDTGALFTPAVSLAAGIGLRTIRDQTEAAGGTLTIRSGPGGTIFQVAAPAGEPKDIATFEASI